MATLDQFPQRDGLYRIMPDAVAVHDRYQDRVRMLDRVASEIWLRADGETSLRDIARDIAVLGNVPIDVMYQTASILAVLMNSEGILYSSNTPETLPYHLQIPQEDQDLDRMLASMVAAGWLNQ
ncbi:MAG: hypothetical protein CL610_09220 [Anaerolineaceae bacterium]|nr:hypothetical protein [Anaerolineaceae bacterium]